MALMFLVRVQVLRLGLHASSIGGYGAASKLNFSTTDGTTGLRKRLEIERQGDISFYEDTGTTPKFFWDASTERLGIGTSSPSGKLEVNGGTGVATSGTLIVRQDGETYNDGISVTSSNAVSHRIWKDANGKLNIGSSSYPSSFVQDIDGNVGIGTTSPNQLLSLNSTESTARGISIDQSGAERVKLLYTNSSGAFDINNTTAGYTSFSNNGSERMRIDSSGKVGIGTSSPATKLHISGDGDTNSKITVERTGAITGTNILGYNYIGTFANSELRLFTNSTEKMRIDSSGNVGIGTTSPTQALDVKGSVSVGTDSSAFIDLQRPTANYIIANKSGTGRLHLTAGADLRFHTGQADGDFSQNERMRIDSSGNLLVGQTSTANYETAAGHHFRPNGFVTHTRDSGTIMVMNRLTNDGPTIDFRRDNTTVGTISVTSSATAYNTSSDERLKENIQDAEDAGSKIDAIQVRQFDWKSDGSHQDYGVIAQELLEVAPEAVTEGETEDDMMSVDYSKLVPTLIKEIQTLRNRVAQLENN